MPPQSAPPLLGSQSSVGFRALAGAGAGDARDAAAELLRRTLTGAGDVHARRGSVARVRVGLAVAAADRVEDVGTDLRLSRTGAGPRALTHRLLAEIARGAVGVRLARRRRARAIVRDRGAGACGLARVGIGLPVAAADGDEHIRADLRARATDTELLGARASIRGRNARERTCVARRYMRHVRESQLTFGSECSQYRASVVA